MYNVRIIHYPDGDRIILYDSPVLAGDDFADFDPDTGEILIKRIEKRPDLLINEFNPFTEEYEYMLDMNDLERRNEHSLQNSLSRARNKVYHLARSNEWEWFFTLTFDPNKVNSFDYGEVTAKLSKWLNNLRSRYAPDLKYIFVPEQHKSGRWHFHGLVSQIGNIVFTHSGRYSHGIPIFNVGQYRLGFSTATEIQSVSKSTYYITKYFTKDLVSATKGKKRYWASKNLSQAPVTEYCFDSGKQFSIADQFRNVRFAKHYDLGFRTVDYIDIDGHDADEYFKS